MGFKGVALIDLIIRYILEQNLFPLGWWLLLLFEKLEEIQVKGHSKVRLKTSGNVLERMYKNKWGNGQCAIKKLSNDLYVDRNTGEVKEFEHISNRSESKASLRRTFALIRDTINANVTDIDKVRWVTITYKENMTDTKQLYEDMKQLRKKVRYHIGHFEYISVIEPQGRGAWHSHELWIFDGKAPYIDQKWLEHEIWNKGSCKVKKLDKNCDNLGAYLTAYLADIPLDEAVKDNDFVREYSNTNLQFDLKEIEVEENGKKVTKKIIKGGRLCMYPPKMNIFRTSRKVKRSEVEYMTHQQAQKKIGAATPTFKKAYKLVDDNLELVLQYEYYNTKRDTV